MGRKIFSVVMGMMLLSGVAVAQDRAVVFDFKGIGADQSTVEAATQIFRNELNNTGKYDVMSKADADSRLSQQGVTDYSCYDVSCAANYGYMVGAENAIIGTITQLGERVTAEVSLVSVVRKEVVFNDSFSASSLSDLDSALRKLARAVADRRKIESEVNRYAITEEETAEPRRKASYITSGASFGFGFPLGNSYMKVDNLKTVAWVMRYEASKFVIENYIGVTWGSAEPDTSYGVIVDKKNISIVPWDIGMRYVFDRGKDFTPFVGGGLGFHFIAAEDVEGQHYIDSDQAIALHVAGGIYAFQSYDFRLTLEGKYTAVFTDAFRGSNNPSQQIGISIGISRKFEKGEHRGCMSGGCMF